MIISGLIFALLVSHPIALKDVPDRLGAFRWFDTLGYTADLKCAFVQVNEWSEYSGQRQGLSSFVGVQLDHHGKGFNVLRLNLESFEYIPTADPNYYARAEIMPKDFSTWAKNAILDATKGDVFDTIVNARSRPMTDRLELFVAARLCALQDDEADSIAFFELAKRDQHNFSGNPNATWLMGLKEDIASTQLLRLVNDLNNTANAWDALLPRFERIRDTFQGTPSGEFARQYAAGLRANINEAEAHKVVTGKELKSMPLEQRVDELIFQLRNQNGSQWSQPGEPDVLSTPRLNDSPAKQLVDIGIPAVSQLMKSLKDKHLTRTVGSGEILTVGEACAQVIGHIANQQMDWRGVSDDPTEFHKYADRWYASVKKVGERETLVRAVRAGSFNSINQANRLVSAYPDAAPAAIKEGLRHADRDSCAYLVQALGEVHSTAAVSVASDYMDHGKYLPARIAAANIAFRKYPEETTRSMIALWRESATNPPNAEDIGSESLPNFLAWTGRPEAVRAMEVGLKARPTEVQSDVVQQFVMGRVPDGGVFEPSPTNKNWDRKQKASYKVAVESLLVSQLSNSHPSASGMTIDKDDLSGCSIGGLAVYGLSKWFPSKYSYRASLTSREEDGMRTAARNTWRRGHGLQAVVARPSRSIVFAPVEKMRPLIDSYVSGDADASKVAEHKIVAIGFPAVKSIYDASLLAHPGSAGRLKLQMLGAKISCFVSDVDVSGSARTLAIAKVIEHYNGLSMNATAFGRLQAEILKSWPAKAVTAQIRIQRDEGIPGLNIYAEFLGKDQSMGTSNNDDSVFYEIFAGHQWLLSGGGGFDLKFAKSAATKAFTSPPLMPMKLEVSLRHRKKG